MFYILCQKGINTLAIMLNSFLVFIILQNTETNRDKYKHILLSFSIFEILYAVLVILGVPTHFNTARTWTVFSYGGILSDTPFAVATPALYCVFYQVWIGFIDIQFIYRYIFLCKQSWLERLEKHYITGFLVIFVLLAYFVTCGFYFCTMEQMAPNMVESIRKTFGIEKPLNLGYILLTMKTADGKIAPIGILTILNHYVFSAMSVAIIIFCGLKIWKAIRIMRKDSGNFRQARLQLQIFMTIIAQTMIPLLLVLIPMFFFGTFPFFESDLRVQLSPLLSILTSITKAVDPFCALICIKEYRRAALRIVRGTACGANVVAPTTATSTKHTRKKKDIEC